MGQQFSMLEPAHRAFIERQKIFFTASAAAGARVNVSPRSTDCLRVLDANAVAYLDRTGSGNETAAHLRADGRLTIMFCAFEGPPRILRLYGTGRVALAGTADYGSLLNERFNGAAPIGARQIVRLDVDLVQTSCGFGVPLFGYAGERDNLTRWAAAKSAEDPDLLAYRRAKNARSIDGLPTGMFEDADAGSDGGGFG